MTRLLEPMVPPYDVTGLAWVVHNLHTTLMELRETTGARKNRKLADLLADTEAATSWLNASVEPPVVTMSQQITLWTCFVAVDRKNADRKLLKTMGAVYFLLRTGNAPPSEAQLHCLLQAAISSRSDSDDIRATHTTSALIACGSLLHKATVQLQTQSLSRRSAATDMLEARVEKSLSGAYRFDLRSRIDDVIAVRGMTPTDVIDTAREVRTGAEAGSGRLLLAAVAHWYGVMPVDMLAMRIFAPSRGLMRMDATCSYMAIRLDGVLTELAVAQLPDVLVAGDTVYLPAPAWMSRLLRPLRAAAPGAEGLWQLPGLDLNPADMRRLLDELHLPARITGGKFVVDRALPLIDSRHDPVRVALATLDFSRIHKVAAAYPHITHPLLLDSAWLRAEKLGWGEISMSAVPGHGYLSKVTPRLQSVQALGAKLLGELNGLRPGPNAGPVRLLQHHGAFIRYTAFMVAVALLLRGQETTLLAASALVVDSMAFNDKGLPCAKAVPPEVAFGPTLRHQLRLLQAHYKALSKRLDSFLGDAVSAELRRLAAGAPDLPLLVALDTDGLQPFTHLDLVTYLGTAWVGKADAIRHSAHDLLREAGFTYASREAALRHVGGAQPIVGETSAWSRNDWLTEHGRMQDALFSAIRLEPCGGLIHSLGRAA